MHNVAASGSESEALLDIAESPKGCPTKSVLWENQKTKPLHLILALLLLSYVIGFAITLIGSVIDLYGGEEETTSSDRSIPLPRISVENGALETQNEKSESKSINAHPVNSVNCSSLIDGQFSLKTGDVLCCDRSHLRTDVCLLRGDVRTHTELSSILLYTNTLIPMEEKIRPYTRKWENSIMNTIDEITLKTINPHDVPESNASACEIRHSVPGVVFSTGGYTGNVYHEFNDGLLPLYITTEHLQREVVLVILEYHDWWMTKYGEIVKQLSNYPVVDFSRDKRVHCFPEMIIGLKIHGELSIDPSLMKDGKSVGDFREALSKGYAPRLMPMPSSDLGSRLGRMDSKKSQMPKLVILSRSGSRVLLNQKQIFALAERIGFQVEIIAPKRTTELVEIFRALNSCDVMLGVHGAAMTHILFMRPGSVFIQIVPLGTDWPASNYYGEPAIKLGLKYIEYKIAPEESSLYHKYEKNDAVLTDPHSITSKGWSETKKVYLDGQDVRPSLKRLKKSLIRAYSLSTARSNN